MAQRHADPHDHLVLRERDVASEDGGIVCQRLLRTAVEAAGAGRNHDVLEEHSVIEPAALLRIPIDGEDKANRTPKNS
jgi:hypothetical protein